MDNENLNFLTPDSNKGIKIMSDSTYTNPTSSKRAIEVVNKFFLVAENLL